MAGHNQHRSLCDHEGLLGPTSHQKKNILFGDSGKSEFFPTGDLRTSKNGTERVPRGAFITWGSPPKV